MNTIVFQTLKLSIINLLRRDKMKGFQTICNTAEDMKTSSNKVLSPKGTKFTKELKSPDQSRFKMASFTEVVKSKSKEIIKKPFKSPTEPKPEAKKINQKYSYLTSNNKKSQMKVIKHYEIDLNQNDTVRFKKIEIWFKY